MRLTCVSPFAANPAITSAAEARKSLPITGALQEFSGCRQCTPANKA